MVGTHMPEDEDLFASALQRMREGFEGLRDGHLDVGAAEQIFHTGYGDALEVAGVLFARRRAGTRHLGAPALDAIQDVLHAITPDDLGRSTPCAEYDVAAVVDHVERSMVLLAGSAGAVLEAAGPGTPEQRIVPLAAATLDAWTGRGLGGEVAVGSRTYPAELAYAIVLLELVVHGWDLATALGRAYSVPAEVVDYLRRQVPRLITPERRGKAFAPEIPVAADAPALSALIAFTGRQP